MGATIEDQYLATSEPYVGRWRHLVSTTNWEKGRIIYEWRQDLVKRGAPVTQSSDEAWSQRVGSVSSQHVGRLRRVWDRFGEVRDEYENRCWSHFQATLDWDDAEMWLEGAIQNSWSVSQMRDKRWEAIGAPDDLKPRDEDIVVADLDEDADPSDEMPTAETFEPSHGVVHAPENGEQETIDSEDTTKPSPAYQETSDENASSADLVEPLRPFADLPSLPADLAEALESFKLAILRHKVANWDDVSADDVIVNLEALRELVTAP